MHDSQGRFALPVIPSPVAGIPARGSVYLRLSVTDACNLSCTYCRPSKPCAPSPRRRRLSIEELLRITARIDAAVGLRKVRLTGGEPLIRPDLLRLVTGLRSRRPDLELCVTTNGLLLADQAQDLAAAGMDRINVSLDTVDPGRFAKLTGKSRLEDVLNGLAAARGTGVLRLKMNAVLLRSVNADGLVALARTARRYDAELRLIELMPFSRGSALFDGEYVSAAEALDRLQDELTLVRELSRSDTARRYEFDDGGRPVTVGLISSVSEPFCGRCDRLRLDSSGRLFSCLRSTRAVDLSARADRETLDQQIEAALAVKREGGTAWPAADMSAIGG